LRALFNQSLRVQLKHAKRERGRKLTLRQLVGYGLERVLGVGVTIRPAEMGHEDDGLGVWRSDTFERNDGEQK
jgi:hypothetical protein